MDEPYLLPNDRMDAEERIRELEELIQGLGEDFRDAFSQSSETWHDNSPFEAVRDKQAMYAAELHYLRTLIRTSTLVLPKKKRGTVGIGNIVRLDNGAQYMIAGDWTPSAGRRSKNGVWCVSRNAPAALAILGKRVGDVVTFGAVSATVEVIT